MISFIIIGRNEGWKLTKCFDSVFNTIKYNKLTKYEVIYVDSKSTDDSIERAKEFPEIKIFQITGICNAAIARNIGAKEAIGDTLFFIDGDMEIMPNFLLLIFSENNGLVYPFVSGQVKNFNYSKDGEFIGNTFQFKDLIEDNYFNTTGGIFIVDKKLWLSNNGFDNNFKMGEDHDFALRMANKGYKLLRKKDIIANHHTISYLNENRMWKTITEGNVLFSNAFLLRKHLFNRFVYNGMLSANYTIFSLILFLIASFILKSPLISMGYFFIVIIKVYKNKKKSILRNIELYIYYLIRDVLFLFSFFFVPMKKIDSSQINYEKNI